MAYDDLLIRPHARKRMGQRNISRPMIEEILAQGEKLRHYPHTKPLPKDLIMGWVEGEAELGTYERGRPVHVVAADDDEREITVVITCYEPDPELWADDLRWKKDWKSADDTYRESPPEELQ